MDLYDRPQDDIIVNEPQQLNNTTTDENIFHWIKDAIFNKKISPSKKYKEMATDTTQTRLRSNNHHLRSNSLDGLTESFYQKYDLLHDNETQYNIPYESSPWRQQQQQQQYQEETRSVGRSQDFNKLRQESLRSPPNVHPRIVQNNRNIDDTFYNRGNNKRWNDEMYYNSPRQGDPLLNKLFNNNKNDDNDNVIRSKQKGVPKTFPGNFPTPMRYQEPITKEIGSNKHNERSIQVERVYDNLLNQLATNTNQLHKLDESMERSKNEIRTKENYYKQNYEMIKNDYMISLKDSQKILDRSIELTKNNRQLKAENATLREDIKYEKEFHLQQMDILKSDMKEAELSYKKRVETMERLLEETYITIENLKGRNERLEYEINRI
ncbi:Branchpoint-bridging protein [Maudiozyma exigua]|uniref:Branchpoint-bridging protein n=1 Tax=Maudiozyma exigua TaxID=34358 RepID=A0A9P6W6S4_MAUEX|nr:Branchpoint-bridging protein [Kazachstania exigua]